MTLDSDDINTSTGDNRGLNGWVTNVVGVTIDDNVAIDNTTSSGNDAFLQLDRKFQIRGKVSNNIASIGQVDLRTGTGSRR